MSLASQSTRVSSDPESPEEPKTVFKTPQLKSTGQAKLGMKISHSIPIRTRTGSLPKTPSAKKLFEEDEQTSSDKTEPGSTVNILKEPRIMDELKLHNSEVKEERGGVCWRGFSFNQLKKFFVW